MDANPFDLAAEFCKLVGVPNLLDYLGTSAQAAPAEVAEKLRARRRFMQGMQANPKFKSEAVFLIKNFNGLTEALTDPRVYAEDAYRRSESGALATLEVTVRGVMAGTARLTPEQEVYLRSHARDLRVAERSYERLLRRVAHELGASLPLPPPTPSLMPQAMPHARAATAATPLAPPDRRDTAPPVIRRGSVVTEGLPARLEVLGDPTREARADVTRTLHIPVRNRGSGPMPATVRVDAAWLVPLQAALDPDALQQTVEVRVVPGLVGDDAVGRVEIHAGPAGSATVEVHLIRAGSRMLRWGALAAGGLLALGVGAGVVVLLPGRPSSLVIAVDPGGTVALDGVVVGSGTTVRIDDPRPGPVEIRVEGGQNFAPWKQAVHVRGGQETRVDALLELVRPLSAQPAGEGPGCDDGSSRRAVGERLPALKRCVAGAGDSPASVVVRVGPGGNAVGLDLPRSALPSPVRTCIERQVAALALAPPPEAPCLVHFEIPRL